MNTRTSSRPRRTTHKKSGSTRRGASARKGRGNVRSGGRRSGGKRKAALDISSFINKAVVATEEVEHFIPEYAFGDFNVDKTIKETLAARGYELPTPIQDKIIPHILKGEDVVGLANTGTGKTAAFLIPLIDKIQARRDEQVLVLAPTRELAIQIEGEFRIFAEKLRLRSVVCVGGAPIGNQIRQLKTRRHFVIGTPGRIIDLLKRGNLSLERARTVVLDEADRMLDMGFIADIRFILSRVPEERHSLCFSATMAPEIEKLVKDFLVEPVKVSVKTQDTSKNVHQDVVRLGKRDKVAVLESYLKKGEFSKVLVFGRTKHGVEKLSRALNKRALKTESIHGDKSHAERQRALKRFKQGEVTALVATDVAARGLDISGVTHVINFDIPETYDDYIHRIGRTGRGTNKGKALTFVA